MLPRRLPQGGENLKLLERRFSSSPRMRRVGGPAWACSWGSGAWALVSSGSCRLWGDLPYLWSLWAHTTESGLLFGLNN